MDLGNVFLTPQNSNHRQYEALRAYFVERLPASEVAKRFGYTVGSVHQLVHQFRQDPHRQFFAEPSRPGVKPDDAVRQQIVQLRKQNLSIYDISEALKRENIQRSSVAVASVLEEEGFAKLPRRADEERPPGIRPTQADRADVRMLSLQPRTFSTKFGGLFLFLPALIEMSFNRVLGWCKLPGTEMVPAAHAMRSLLALKLFSNRRHVHVMSAVLDEGLALFAGLNVVPKRSFLTEYSCRVSPACYPKLMRHWFDAMTRLGLEHGSSFDLDFHTIAFHGEDALLQKHYVSKRSRRQKGILAFFGPRRRQAVLLLRQHRPAKRTAGRRDSPVRQVLEAAYGQASRRTDFRLEADDVCEPKQAGSPRGAVHNATAPRPQVDAGTGRPASQRLAADRTGWRVTDLQIAANS